MNAPTDPSLLFSASWAGLMGDTYETAPMPTMDAAVAQAILVLNTYDIPGPVDGIVYLIRDHVSRATVILKLDDHGDYSAVAIYA